MHVTMLNLREIYKQWAYEELRGRSALWARAGWGNGTENVRWEKGLCSR